MVLGLEELIIVGIPNPELIHPVGIRGPRPVARSGLRPSVFNAQPGSGNLGGRSVDCEVLALTNKIHPFEVMFVTEVIVYLRQAPVYRVVVR